MKRVLYIACLLLSCSSKGQDKTTHGCDLLRNIFNSEDTTYPIIKRCDTTLVFIENRPGVKKFYNCDTINTRFTKVIFVYYDTSYLFVYHVPEAKNYKGRKLLVWLMKYKDSTTHMLIENLDDDWRYEDLLLSENYQIVKREYKRAEY